MSIDEVIASTVTKKGFKLPSLVVTGKCRKHRFLIELEFVLTFVF